MNSIEESIFHAAFERDDPVERAAFVEHACAQDPVLRQRVELLLSAYQAGQSLEPNQVA